MAVILQSQTFHQIRWPSTFVTNTTHYLSLSADWNFGQILWSFIEQHIFQLEVFTVCRHLSWPTIRRATYQPAKRDTIHPNLDQLNPCKKKLRFASAWIFEGSRAVMYWCWFHSNCEEPPQAFHRNLLMLMNMNCHFDVQLFCFYISSS